MVSILIIAILLVLVNMSAISEAAMDKLQFHFDKSIFSNFKNQKFWDPRISHLNKYKNQDVNQGEAFLYSTTLFVGLTDGWHLMKLLKNLTMFTAVFVSIVLVVNGFLVAFAIVVALRVSYGYVFEQFFDKIFNKHPQKKENER